MSLYQKVYYIDQASSNEVSDAASGGGGLGSGLLVSSRVFRYNTYDGHGDYDLNQQGLISFVAADPTSPYGDYKDGGFRIVTKADGTMDALPFAKAVSAVCSYGTSDEGLSQASLETIAKARFVELRCGPTIDFTRSLASQVGLTSRIVRMLTADTPNDFDDGHVAMEIHDGTKWIMFDIANDLVWKDGSGNYLSQAEIFEAGIANCTPELLAEPRLGTRASGWIMAFHEQQFLSKDTVIDWCGRIYQIPGIDHADGKTYWYTPSGTESRSPWIEGLSSDWEVVSKSTWDNLFY